MTPRELIRKIWLESPGLIRGTGILNGCRCAVNTAHKVSGDPLLLVSAKISMWKTIEYNDQFFGSMEDRRDLMIAHLDAGRLDLK